MWVPGLDLPGILLERVGVEGWEAEVSRSSTNMLHHHLLGNNQRKSVPARIVSRRYGSNSVMMLKK